MIDYWTARRVLVTGGAGFLGSHLSERLVSHGASVTVVDNLSAGSRRNLSAVEASVQLIEADVLDREAMTRVMAKVSPSILFHLAANPSVPLSVANPGFDFDTNAGGTFNMLNAARLSGRLERAVILSSGAVYGEPATVPIRESDPLQPISPYGASKLHAEICAGMFHRVYGVDSVIARLFNVYGPRMRRFVVRDLLHKLRENPLRLELLGDGGQIREFTSVSDAVDGLMRLAERGAPGEPYNLSSGQPTSIRELAAQIVRSIGLTDRTEIVCTGESWPGDAQRWEVALDKISAIGFTPRVGLESGLRDTIDWFEREEGEIWPLAEH